MKTSVLVNNYNHAAWLPACLESVLAQTHPADEIIVYDDGSSDDSLAVARRYAPRVSVIAGRRFQRPNRVNQGNAIHEAFIHSTGDILFLLDGDDVFTPTKIALYLEAFSHTPRPVLVQAPMHWIDAAGRHLTRLPEPFKHTPNPLATTYATQDPDLFYPTSSLAFTRDFLSRALPLDWSDDINLWSDTRLALAAVLTGPVITLPDELGGWRQHPASDSARQSIARTHQLRQTLRRTQVFNHLAQQAGLPTLSVWRNRRFFFQLLRVISPSIAFRFYEKYVAKMARALASLTH